MPAGAVFYFDDGAFQIDGDVRVATLAFRTTYSGPFTADTRPFVGTLYQFDLTVPSNVKSLFFSCNVQNGIALFSRVGTTWRFVCGAQAAIEVYGFADQTITPTNSGLQLYNAAGVLTFDAGAKWLRVADIHRSAVSGASWPWPSTSRKYAAGFGSYPKRSTGAAQAGLPYWVLRSYMISVGPANVMVGEGPITSRLVGGGGDPPPGNSPLMQPPTLMVIDVTNY